MEFESMVVVNRPVEQVFAGWADIERYPEWFDSSLERRKLTEGPVGVGTRYHGVEKMPGKRIQFTLEITAFEPNRRIAAKLSPPANAEWEATFESLDGDASLTLRSVAHLGDASLTLRSVAHLSGITGLLAPVLANWARRTQQKGLNRFKASMEAEAS